MFDEIDPKIVNGICDLQKRLNKLTRSDGKAITDSMAVYRYMPIEHFLDLVENRWFAFAHISLWEDPFEGFLFKVGKQFKDRRRMYAGFYGQSWTFGSHESDLRWRAYCPNRNGVRIKSTVGALRELANGFVSNATALAKIVDGPITYVDDKVWKSVKGICSSNAHFLFPKSRAEMANLLFLKRELFKWENEYRIIGHIGHDGLRELALCESNEFVRVGGLLKCKINRPVDHLINEVLIDPRVAPADVDRLMCRLIQADCKLKVSQSDAYQWPNFDV